jgi:hypothetical protein
MPIDPMSKEDKRHEDMMLLIKRIALTAAIIMGLLLWYEGTKPEDNDPYAECWTFIVGWDGSCKADLAANALNGRGYTHSKAYLNGYK